MPDQFKGQYNVNELGLCSGIFIAPPPPGAVITDHLTGNERVPVAVFGLLFNCGRCSQEHQGPPMVLDVHTAAGIIAQITEQARAGGTLVALEAAVDQTRLAIRPNIWPE